MLSFNLNHGEARSTNKAAMMVGCGFDKKEILPWNIVDVNKLAVFPGEPVREPNSLGVEVASVRMNCSEQC